MPGTTAWPEGQRGYVHALQGLARRPDEPLALSLRLPFCAAHCLFCDQPVQGGAAEHTIDQYLGHLLAEMHTLAATLGSQRDLVQVHLGGGNGNELSASQLSRLVEALGRHWRLPAEAEQSIDCDLRRTGWVQLQLLRTLGFRHINVGVMDLSPRVQRAIGRLQSATLVADACDQARACGMRCINLKLMLGLPYQSLATWRDTLAQVLRIGPDRITVARYRHRPGRVAAQRLIDDEAVPDAALLQALAEITVDTLCAAGYLWIGADTFVLDGDSLSKAAASGSLCHGPLGCTARANIPVLGLGTAAVGQIDGRLVVNQQSLPDWQDAVCHGVLPVAWIQPHDERARRARRAVSHLVCHQVLPREMAQDGLAPAYQRLARHQAQGWVRVLDDRIEVTRTGRYRLAQLCADLEALALDAP